MKMKRQTEDNIILLLGIVFIIISMVLYFGYTLPYEVRENRIAKNTMIPVYAIEQSLKPHDFIYGLHLDFSMLGVAMLVLYLNPGFLKVSLIKEIKKKIKKVSILL
jgi:hypothetical protein